MFFSEHKDIWGLYNDVKVSDQERIENRLNRSFGKPFDVSAKFNFGFSIHKFSQYFSTNGGAVLLVSDPVFSELQGFIFHDYLASSSYLFHPIPNLIVKPQLNYGARRILDRHFTSADLVEDSLDVDFNKEPYVGFGELNVSLDYQLREWGNVLFTANSLPLIRNKYEYWETFLGFQTKNFVAHKEMWLNNLQLFAGYSPFYAGNYDVKRTIKTGVKFAFGERLGLNLFTSDDFYPGAFVEWEAGFFKISIFTFERSFDDYEIQTSRQYGFSLRLFF